MLGFPIAMRTLVDHLRFPELQRSIEKPVASRRIDTTSMSVDLKYEARLRTQSEIEALTVLTAHVTDIDNGFGVADYQIAKWRRLLIQGKVPAELMAQLIDPSDLGGSSYELALMERYSGTPYQGLGSRRLGAVRNHPVVLRTSHGGPGGNEGAGWALDCGNTEAMTDALLEAGHASLGDTIREQLPLGTGRVVVVGHRAWEKSRREDPGVIVWREVVRPVVDALSAEGLNVVIGYNTKAGSGLYIPKTWDDDAIYDNKGIRLAA